jgi:HK97 family phage major capsid protein
MATTAPAIGQQRPRFSLTERELRQYSLARAILTISQNQEGSERAEQSCFELEVSETLAKSHVGENRGGLFIPWNIGAGEFERKGPRMQGGQRAGLDSATATKGTELKFTRPGDFLEYLYNSMRVKELGATVVSGLRDNVAYPKQTGKATGAWVAENPGSDIADSNLTLGQVPSSPHTYQSSTSYSRQLLAQAVIDVDTLVRQDLARDMALSLDFAAIAGPTGGASPVGIMNTTGVQSYVVASDSGNGGTIVYVDVLKMLEDLEDVNADQLGDPGWLTTPSIKSDLKNTTRLANLIALPVWGDDDTVGGYMARSSNQVPKTGTRGSTSNNHALILGVWRTLVIGMWGSGFELIVDPFRLKKQGMIELTTFAMTDVELKYPQGFIVAQVQK